MFVCLLFPLVSALLLSPCGLESVVRGSAGINLGNLISGPVFTALNISISLGWLTGQQLGSSEARHMFNKQISQSSCMWCRSKKDEEENNWESIKERLLQFLQLHILTLKCSNNQLWPWRGGTFYYYYFFIHTQYLPLTLIAKTGDLWG